MDVYRNWTKSPTIFAPALAPKHSNADVESLNNVFDNSK
jgi:hypothetical protein